MLLLIHAYIKVQHVSEGGLVTKQSLLSGIVFKGSLIGNNKKRRRVGVKSF